MRRTLLLITVAAALAAAGCIAPPNDATDRAGGRVATDGGEMSAQEKRQDKAEVCTDGGILGGSGGFCAERRIEVTGALSGIPAMSVDLSTFNGRLGVRSGEAGAWGFVAVLQARGATEAEARAALERIAFSWSHVDGDDHFLRVEARHDGRSGDGLSASVEATLPRDLVMALGLQTTNGAIDVEGVRTDGLSAQATNAAIRVRADVTDAALFTTNGAVEATLTPVGSGRIQAQATNGAIDLRVPEDARHGYDLTARTTNGEVEVRLRDGETTSGTPSNPYYDPNNDARFRTNGFESRDVRSAVTLGTTNGRVTVEPL